MNLKRALISFVIAVTIIVGYFSFFTGSLDVSPERFFAKDSLVMISFDFSSNAQRQQVADLIGKFGDSGFVDDYFEGVEFDYSKLKEVLSGQFKLTLGLEGADGGAFSAVGYFERADEMEEFVRGIDGIERVSGGAVDVWQRDEGFVARYGEIFVFTDRSEFVDSIKERAESDGFDLSPKYLAYQEKFGSENLGYLFMDGEKIGDQFDGIYGEWGDSFKESVEVLEDIYMTAMAEDTGIRFVSESTLDGEIDGAGYEVDLFKNISADGVILYGESGKLRTLLEPLLAQVLGEMELEDYLGETLGVEAEVVGEFLDSPFAFKLADVGQVYPGVAFYVGLDKAEVGKEVSVGVDGFVDGVITEYDQIFKDLGDVDGEGAFKKETIVVQGGGVHKVAVDWKALPVESLATLSFPPVFDIKDVLVELYYGVTGENVFVLALEPGFGDSYGKNVLSEDEVFSEAYSLLGGGMKMSYLRPEGLMGLLDKYIEFGKLFGVVEAGDEASYEEFRESVKAWKYFIGGTSLKKDLLMGASYLRIE